MSACLALFLVLAGALDFGVDWSAFRAGGDSSRVEFFYAVPYDQLLYVQTDSGAIAEFSVRLEMAGLDNTFRQEGTIFKRARVRSFAETYAAQRNFVDGFSVTAPPGTYRFKIALAETSDAGQTEGSREDTIVLTGFGHGLAISSLQVGSTALTDTATGKVSVLPNPMHRFATEGLEALYVYFEGYNFSADSNAYRVRAAIFRDRAGKSDTVIQTPVLSKPKQGTAVAYALGVSVAGMEPGDYTLGVELTDVATGRSVTAGRGFVLGTVALEPAATSLAPDSLSPFERKYYDQIQYLTTPRQLAYYQALSEAGKGAYLAKFWSARDLAEFSRRMETADVKYRQPRVSGRDTDRGRIYVKYGEPDAVEQKVIEVETRPREYWHYYNTGYVFVFIDIRQDNNYRLAWTNAREEPKTGLESYLTVDEQEQFE